MPKEKSEKKLFPSVAKVLSLVKEDAILVGSAVTSHNVKECKDIDIVVNKTALRKLVKHYRMAMNISDKGAFTVYAYEKIIDVFLSKELDCLDDKKNEGRVTFEEALTMSLVEVRPYGVIMRGLKNV